MKLLLILTCLLPLAGISLHAADRVALVIGNNAYTSFPDARQLTSPRADATDVAMQLRAIGFTVLEPVLDGTREKIIAAKARFLEQAKDAQIALFYFSGHGFQVGEENFLIPSDMPRITSYTVLKDNALLLRDSLMVGLEEADAQTKVIVLDCCRDNPFAAQLEKALSGTNKSLRTKGGTGEISGYGAGFYLAFATSPGTTADDGNGQRNSPFTSALLTHLKDKAGENIRDLFDEVKETVREKSGEEQVPWTNDSLSKSHVKILAKLSSEVATAKDLTTGQPKAVNSGVAQTAMPQQKGTKEWEVFRLGDKDYVNGASIHRFYRFSTHEQDGEDVWFRSPTIIMKGKIGSSELFINNIKFILHKPIASIGGEVLISRTDLSYIIDPVLRPSKLNARQFDTVIIDVQDKDAKSSPNGREYTLQLARLLEKDLNTLGFKVVVNVSDADVVSPIDYVELTERSPNSVFVRLCCNQIQQGKAGINTFASISKEAGAPDQTDGSNEPISSPRPYDCESVALATALNALVVHRFKLVDLGIKRHYLEELESLTCPSVVFNFDYMEGDAGTELIAKSSGRLMLSLALANSIANYRIATLARARKPEAVGEP
jgi:N-acetylmuramoyl-L-alanine amidase